MNAYAGVVAEDRRSDGGRDRCERSNRCADTAPQALVRSAANAQVCDQEPVTSRCGRRQHHTVEVYKHGHLDSFGSRTTRTRGEMGEMMMSGMAGMGVLWLLVLIVAALVGAAAIKYLFFSKRD